MAEVRDPATPWDEASRYFLNAPAATASVLVDPRRWAALVSPERIAGDSRIGIGFDGSHSFDGTALAIADEAGHVELPLLIERSPSDPPTWTVPRHMVHEVLADIFDTYDVVRMYCDPFFWRSELDQWARQYGDEVVVEFPTNTARRFGPAVDRFRAAAAEGAISHDGDADLARHLANARLVRGRGRAEDDGHALFTLEKAGHGRYIDASVAAILALEAIASVGPLIEREPMVAWR